MKMTEYSLQAFCLVLIVLNACEATYLPGLELITDCVEAKCDVRSCLKTNQGELTQKAKGCIVHDCKNAIKLCMKQIPKNVLAYVKSTAEMAETYAGVGLDIFSDSYLQCWPRTENGTHLTDCVIDDLLETVGPFIDLYGSILFDDPAFAACWIVQTVRIIVMLGIDSAMDTDYHRQYELNTLKEAHRNLYEYLRCFGFKQRDADCINMWNRVFGTPAWMKRQTKDNLVGLLHNLISVSMKCRPGRLRS